MKLTTKDIKQLIATKLLREPLALEELTARRGGNAPDGVGYFDSNLWRRHKKCKINSLDEEEAKIGFGFISSLSSDCFLEYTNITFPCIYRLFVLDVEKYDDYDDYCPDDTCLGIITDEKDENILAFGFTCD